MRRGDASSMCLIMATVAYRAWMRLPPSSTSISSVTSTSNEVSSPIVGASRLTSRILPRGPRRLPSCARLGQGGPAMPPLRETPARVFLRFLRFGVLAWGGPVAQIAMIRRELVDEERWIGSSRFNRVLAVYQALPGPEAHELCVYFGHLAGVIALIVRGAITIGRHALTDPLLWAIGVGGFVATLAGTHFAVVLITAGVGAVLRLGR